MLLTCRGRKTTSLLTISSERGIIIDTPGHTTSSLSPSSKMLVKSLFLGGLLSLPAVFAAPAAAPNSLDNAPPTLVKRALPTSTFSNKVIFSPPSNAGWTDPRVLYARAIQLSDGSLLSTWENYSPEPPLVYFPIFKSTDGGVSWTEIGKIEDQVNGWGLRYQPDLYELPRAIGKFPKGTIIGSGNSIPTDLSKTKIDVYASTDGGKSWKFVSSIAEGGEARPNNGLTPVWEPYMMYVPFSWSLKFDC